MVHFITCFYIILPQFITTSTVENEFEGTWLQDFDMTVNTNGDLYAISFYWTV